MAFTRYERKKKEQEKATYDPFSAWDEALQKEEEPKKFLSDAFIPKKIPSNIEDAPMAEKQTIGFGQPTTGIGLLKSSQSALEQRAKEAEPLPAQFRDPLLSTYGSSFAQPSVGLPKEVGGKPLDLTIPAKAVVEGAKESYGGMTSGISEAVSGLLSSVPEGSPLNRLFGPTFQQDIRTQSERTQEQIAQDIAPSTEYIESLDKPYQLIGRGLGGAAVQVPGMIVSPLSMAGVLGISAGGGKAQEIRQAGGTGTQQLLGGLAAGGLEFGTEALTGALFKNLKYLKNIPDEGVKGALKEMTSEFLGESLTEAADPYINVAFIKDYEMPSATERFLNSLDAGISGAIGSLLFTGTGLGLNKVVDNFNQKQDQQSLDELRQAVEEKTGVSVPVIELQQAVTEARIPKLPSLPQVGRTVFEVERVDSLYPKLLDEASAVSPEIARPFLKDYNTEAEIQNAINQLQSMQTTTIEQRANEVLGELKNTGRAYSQAILERNAEGMFEEAKDESTGMPRTTSDTILEIIDGYDRKTDLKYEEIERALKNIVEGKSTKIADYIKTVLEKQITENYQTEFYGKPEAVQAPTIEWATTPNVITPEVQGMALETQITRPSEKAMEGFKKKLQTSQNFKTMLEKNLVRIPEAKYISQLNEQQVIEEVNRTLKESTQKTLDYDIAKLKELSKRADMLKMNLQLFAETKQEIQNVMEQATPEEQTMLKKHIKALDDMATKGVTKATTNEFKRLIQQQKVIKESVINRYEKKITKLKEKQQEQLAKQKTRYEDKLTAQKEKVARQKEKINNSKKATRLLELTRRVKKLKYADDVKPVINEFFGNIDTIARGMSSKKQLQLNELKSKIEAIREEGGYIDPRMEKAVERLDKTQIKDMSPDDIDILTELAEHIIHANQRKNKATRLLQAESIRDLGSRWANEIEPSIGEGKQIGLGKGVVEFLWGVEGSTPKNLFFEMGNGKNDSISMNIFQGLRNAENKEINNYYALEGVLTEAIPGYKDLPSDKYWSTPQDVNGVMLTPAERVSLKLAIKDPNVRASIEKSGAYIGDSLKPRKFTVEEINNMPLNVKEGEIIKASKPLFDATFEMFDEAHYELNGTHLKQVNNYFPKDVSKLSFEEELGNMINNPSLSNEGATIERTNNTLPVRINGIFDVLQKQINKASKYNAWVTPMQEFNKILSVPNVRESMRSRFGMTGSKSIVENYFDKLFQDLQGTTLSQSDALTKLVDKGLSNFITAKLGFRPTTIAKQAMSYGLAATHLDYDVLAKGVLTIPNIQEMADNNARARVRVEGRRIDSDINAFNKVTKLAMKGITDMDLQTTGRLWEATKLQVKKDNPGISYDEMLERASVLFDDVLDTQPNYTALERSGLMRNKNTVTRALTLFGSAKNAAFNEAKHGILEYKGTGDKKYLAKAITGIIMSGLGLAGIDELRRELLNKEGDYISSVISNIAGIIPFADSLSSMIRGFDIQVPSVELLNDMYNSAEALYGLATALASGEEIGKDEISKKVNRFVSTIGETFTGMPIENIKEDITYLLTGTDMLGLPTDVVNEVFRKYTDPYSRTEFYQSLVANANDPEGIKAMADQMEFYNITYDQVKSNLDKYNLTREERINILKTIRENR